jgi:hypothetical protein
MVYSRDKLYIEDKVSEADIDRTIKELGLENDKEFSKVMRDADSQITEVFKKH